MDKIQLENNANIFDYVKNHAMECKGRKIFTNKKMIENLVNLAGERNIYIQGKTMQLTFINQENKNLALVEIVKEGSDCYWFKDIKAKNITSIAPVDTTKEPMHIINKPSLEKVYF